MEYTLELELNWVIKQQNNMKFYYKTAVRGIHAYGITPTANALVIIQADKGKYTQ